jgi:hypothetical protein
MSNDLADYYIDDYNIVNITPKNVLITDQMINDNSEEFRKFVKEQKVKVLVDNSVTLPYNKKQRLAFEEQTNQYCLALAIMSSSAIGNTLGNIFIAMSRSKVPMKLFSNKESAIK